jgi:uncharacterized membrane protein YozB (DUF420 family)
MSLPLVNACLNASATVLLCAGLLAIKRERRELHERLMYAAFAVSTAFLACYVYYHVVVRAVTKFNGTSFVKGAYLAMLATHVVLAIVNVPLVLRTLFLARHARWEAHKRWAKITFPIWLYVSVTGVLVYLVLYVWNPAPEA